MCGRYSITTTVTDEHLIAIYQAMEKRYAGAYKTGEIFPGDSAPAVIQWENRIIAVPGVFGLPGFQGNRLLINARSETVAKKRTFSESLRQRRTIIPATRFYEWSHNQRKLPHRRNRSSETNKTISIRHHSPHLLNPFSTMYISPLLVWFRMALPPSFLTNSKANPQFHRRNCGFAMQTL